MHKTITLKRRPTWLLLPVLLIPLALPTSHATAGTKAGTRSVLAKAVAFDLRAQQAQPTGQHLARKAIIGPICNYSNGRTITCKAYECAEVTLGQPSSSVWQFSVDEVVNAAEMYEPFARIWQSSDAALTPEGVIVAIPSSGVPHGWDQGIWRYSQWGSPTIVGYSCHR